MITVIYTETGYQLARDGTVFWDVQFDPELPDCQPFAPGAAKVHAEAFMAELAAGSV